MSSVAASRPAVFQRLPWTALGVGALALGACAIGAVIDPAQFFRAYLAAYVFFLGLALGCLAILMIYHLTGGAWGFLIRRILEAGVSTLPLLALLFVPVACGVGYLYLWAQPDIVAINPKLQHQQLYLNVPFFWVRAALYFLAWMGVALVLNLWSAEEERTGDPRWSVRLGYLSGAGLVVYGITMHFASIDWIMSLQPAFRSTIFGPLVAAAQLTAAQALVLIVLAVLVRQAPLSEATSTEALNDLGNLLLSFLVIWAYLVWFQFMLIWIANLPVDVVWYLPRSRGGWQWVLYVLCAFGFVVPFGALLLRAVKRSPRTLAWVAGLICFMQLVFAFYQVMPAFTGTTIADHWMDFLTPLGVGGLWLALFAWQLGRRPLLPERDPSEAQALVLRHRHESERVREEALTHG